ncbi:MAG: hypothetical protein KDC98_21880 [Planctomycetes bacterium]|nr:hypothetical protein [Planctomycetota bacterium]
MLGAVPTEFQDYMAFGVLAALVAGAVALWLNGLFLSAGQRDGLAADGAILAGRLQGLLAAAFGVKLAVVVIAVFALRQAGVKFEATATFCVTFAAVSLISQLTTASMLARSFGRRSSSEARVAPAVVADATGASESESANPS